MTETVAISTGVDRKWKRYEVFKIKPSLNGDCSSVQPLFIDPILRHTVSLYLVNTTWSLNFVHLVAVSLQNQNTSRGMRDGILKCKTQTNYEIASNGNIIGIKRENQQKNLCMETKGLFVLVLRLLLFVLNWTPGGTANGRTDEDSKVNRVVHFMPQIIPNLNVPIEN